MATEAKPAVQADSSRRRAGAAPERTMTIGGVCKTLRQEFPDVSISKIRYLEDQKLLSPRRTPGGYRVYTPADVARLRTILRLQRDEFLPLRVIRQELAAGRLDGEPTGEPATGGRRAGGRPSAVTLRAAGPKIPLEELLEHTGASRRLVEELEEYGVIRGEERAGVRRYDEIEEEIVRAVGELAGHGVSGRNLRLFRSSADRETDLLRQILAPALRSRDPQRRKEAIETLENLAAVTTRLKHLLVIGDLRRFIA